MTIYSGDEFYGDEVTSPMSRPIDQWMHEHNLKPATPDPKFEKWIARLNAICWRKVGCSLDDLEDFDTGSAYEDGMTPSCFFREVIAPEVGLE